MNKLFLVIGLFAILVSDVMAQNYAQGSPNVKDWVYTPRKYNAIAATGDSIMTGKIANAATTDTLQPVIISGWNQVHLIISADTAGSTAGVLNLLFQGSRNGQTFSTYLVPVDSIKWAAAGPAYKSFNLSQVAGGFYSVRPVIKGTASGSTYTGTGYYSVQIRKKP